MNARSLDTSATQQQGFTLLELMLALSLLAALILMALPSWQHVRQQQARAHAQQTLRLLAQKLEQHYNLTGNYTLTLTPFIPSDSPYRYSHQNPADTQSYTLQAEPTGQQLADVCGTLLLNAAQQRGAGGVLDNRASLTQACWQS